MKTIEELYEELIESNELQSKLKNVTSDEEMNAFLKDQNCSISSVEFSKLLMIKALKQGDLSEEALEMISEDMYSFIPNYSLKRIKRDKNNNKKVRDE